MSNTLKASLATLLANAIFGFSFLFTKVALEYSEPSVLLSIRFLVSFVVLNLFILAGKQKISLKGKPVGKLLIMGLIQPVIYYFCETKGIALTTASFSGVMIGLIPVAGLILGVLFLKERCTAFQVFCTILSVTGVAMTTTGGFGTFSLPGFLFLLGAVISAATFTAISRSISHFFSAFERTYVISGMGTVAFTLMALVQNRSNPSVWLRPLDEIGFWLPLLYLAVLSSVCGFLLYNYSLNHLKAGHVLLMSNSSTVVSVLAGIFLLGDSFTAIQLAGICIIVLSVIGISWQQGKSKADEA